MIAQYYANDENFKRALEEIQKFIDKLKYGQFSISEPICHFLKNANTGDFIVQNIFNFQESKVGTCLELQHTTSKWLTNNSHLVFPGIKTFARCSGFTKSGYFSIDDDYESAHHNFLIVSPVDFPLLNGFLSLRESDQDTLKSILGGSYIVDPSFKTLEPYDESDYVILEISGRQNSYSLDIDVLLIEGLKIPIFIDYENTLWFLGKFQDDHSLAIYSKTKDRLGVLYWQSILIDNRPEWELTFDGCADIINLLRQIYIKTKDVIVSSNENKFVMRNISI